MALWKESGKTSPAETPEAMDMARLDIPETRPKVETPAQPASRPTPTPTPTPSKPKTESLIAPDITIEPGARVTGSVRAEKVTIAGELTGNIESAAHVELQQSGALTGDLKAGSLSVAAGSRMRGQAEFGWDDAKDGNSTHKNQGHTGAPS